MSVDEFCAKGKNRCGTFTTRGGVLWHEEAGEVLVESVRSLHELERWIKPGNVLALCKLAAPVEVQVNLRDTIAAAPQRADAEILMDAQIQRAHAPRADEEHIQPEILPVASLPGLREASTDEIEKHNLLHDPAMPCCDICITSKGRDDFH